MPVDFREHAGLASTSHCCKHTERPGLRTGGPGGPATPHAPAGARRWDWSVACQGPAGPAGGERGTEPSTPPARAPVRGKLSSMKSVLGAEEVGDHCLRTLPPHLTTGGQAPGPGDPLRSL